MSMKSIHFCLPFPFCSLGWHCHSIFWTAEWPPPTLFHAAAWMMFLKWRLDWVSPASPSLWAHRSLWDQHPPAPPESSSYVPCSPHTQVTLFFWLWDHSKLFLTLVPVVLTAWNAWCFTVMVWLAPSPSTFSPNINISKWPPLTVICWEDVLCLAILYFWHLSLTPQSGIISCIQSNPLSCSPTGLWVLWVQGVFGVEEAEFTAWCTEHTLQGASDCIRSHLLRANVIGQGGRRGVVVEKEEFRQDKPWHLLAFSCLWVSQFAWNTRAIHEPSWCPFTRLHPRAVFLSLTVGFSSIALGVLHGHGSDSAHPLTSLLLGMS